MNWTAVTFHTPEYSIYAESWRSTIEALGGKPVVIEMPTTGNYNRNTGLKPSAILRAWSLVEEGWFLYTDIDTQVLKAPCPPHEAWDVGITDNLFTHHVNRIASAYILFRKTPGALRFIEHWEALCKRTRKKDHPLLTRTIRDHQSGRRSVIRKVASAWKPNGLRPT